jgi:hypothetical protein
LRVESRQAASSIGKRARETDLVSGVAVIAEHGGAEPVERAVWGGNEIDLGFTGAAPAAKSRQPQRVDQVSDAMRRVAGGAGRRGSSWQRP